MQIEYVRIGGHSAMCSAHAIACAEENWNEAHGADMYDMGMEEFREAAAEALRWATHYLESGDVDCTCEVGRS